MRSAARHRLDLAPQAAERQAVDAREQRAVAPFLVGGAAADSGRARRRPRARAAPSPIATRDAGSPDARGQRGDGRRADAFEPAADDRRAAHPPRSLGARRANSGLLHRRREPHRRAAPAARRPTRSAATSAAARRPVVHVARRARTSASAQPSQPARSSSRTRKQAERQQRVVQLVGVAHHGPCLPRHLGDRAGVERAEARRRAPASVWRSDTARARRSSSGASSRYVYGFEFRISCDSGDGATVSIAIGADVAIGRSRPSTASSPSTSIASCRQLSIGLVHQRVVGDRDRAAGHVLGAAELRGEDGRQQVLGAHALERHRHLLARLDSAAAPARASRSSASGWRTSATRAPPARGPRRSVARPDHGEDALQREAVLLAERQHDAVVGGGGLQLEVEADAEALAQREPEGPVDAPAERRVHDELHAARLVEEALGDDGGVASASAAERRRAVAHVRRRAAPRASGGEPALAHEPGERRGALCAATASRSRATAADSSRVRAGASPSQNGIVGGAPCGVLDAHAPRSRRAGSATSGCRAGRCRRACSRRRSPRSPCRPARPCGSSITS